MILIILDNDLQKQYLIGEPRGAFLQFIPTIQAIKYNLYFYKALLTLVLIIICMHLQSSIQYTIFIAQYHMDFSATFQAENQSASPNPQLLREEIALKRISSITQSIVKKQSSSQMNFQEFLHLQLKIEKARELLLKVNLAITQCYQFFYTENKKILQGSGKSQGQRENELCFFMGDKGKQENSVRKQWIQESLRYLQLFKSTLTIRQLQLSMILFIMQYRSTNNFASSYLQNFGELEPYIIKLDNTKKKINMTILQGLFTLQQQFLQIYCYQVNNLIKFQSLVTGNHDFQFSQELSFRYQNIINKIKIANSKIKTISEIFSSACIKDSDDLFSFNQVHQRWQRLISKDIIKHIQLSDRTSLRKNFDDLKKNLNVVNATMSIIDRYRLQNNKSFNHNIKILYERSLKIMKCALSKEQALFQAEMMFSEPKGQLTKEIWNLPENKKFRQFIELCLPSIHYSQVMYLPRIYKQYFYLRLSQKESSLPESSILLYQQLFQKKSYEETIRIRINYSKELSLRIEKSHQKQSFMGKWPTGVSEFLNSVTSLLKKQQRKPKGLIFHIHGGGFISMSSFIHQTYIRKWANQLNVPIISVDYGKAPQRPFPQGLYDCFEAYMFAILKFKQIYEIEPQKIILIGDSAGGNLVASLTNLLIRWDLPLPSGIVLVYPALNLDLSNYTPSFLTALNDSILPHTFLKICAKSYLSETHQSNVPNNDLISPMLADQSILRKYPKTFIFVGSKDPFHDDCCRFIERLHQHSLNICQLSILQEFPHGFLQFDLKLMPNDFSRIATDLVLKTLQELIS